MREPLKLKTDYLNLLLDVAGQRTRERGDLAYGRHVGVSLRDVRLLRLIGKQPEIVMGELCSASGVEKTLASKLVSSLVQRGLVERHIGEHDARQIRLCLTDAGAELVMRAEPLGRQLEHGFQYWLSKDEIQVLRRTLEKIIAAESASREQFTAWLDTLGEHAEG